MDTRRWGIRMGAVGVVVQLVGLAIDSGADASATTAAADAGRTIFLAGLALCGAGILLALSHPILAHDPGKGDRLRRFAQVSAPLVLLAIVGGTATAAQSSRDTTSEHAAEHSALDSEGQVSAGTVALAGAEHDHATMDDGAAADAEHAHEDAAVGGPNAVPVDQVTRDALAAQLVGAREAVLRTPTVADALAAGFLPAGEFTPGAGAHFMNGAHMVGDFDPGQPNALIADGDSPTSRIVGAMYTSLGDAAPPDGFAGPYDEWHQHANVCFKPVGDVIEVPFPADRDITQEMCDGVGGQFMETTVWMVHAWVVPGWDSPQGVFSHDHAQLVCRTGTTVDDRGFCPGT